jgi:NADH-quinone oxidoreductase subunit K
VTTDNAALFGLFGIGVVLTLVIGFYGILVTRNLLRALIGMEILTKAVTLLIVVCGYVTGTDAQHRDNNIALAQALAITLIIIEVAVIVVGVGVVMCIFRNTGSIDKSGIRNLKG